MDKRTLVRLRRVCGFTAWQNVNLNLANFDDLSKDARGKLFDNNIQTYVAFPKDLRDTAIKLTMKMISSAWRTYKYRLAGMWRSGWNPFKTYSELKQEDWKLFIANRKTEEFQTRIQQMSQLRSRNAANHRLGPAGYSGKKRQWEAEDEELARAGVENVWKKFPGRPEPYIRARALLVDPCSGELVISQEFR